MFLNLRDTAISKIKQILKREKIRDDFDWQLYHYHYLGELAELQKLPTQKISKQDYVFESSNLILRKNILPIHPNHRLLYKTILQLQPKSVMEIGCGGGDHLSNLNILYSELNIFGCDLSEEQLSFLKKRSPHLSDQVKKLDITLPHSSQTPVVDACYTNAVIMHIKTGNGHFVALSNIFKIATKYIVLMENWTAHNFMNDIKFLWEGGMIPWNKLYFYYRRAPEYGNKPHLMVISAEPLSYEPLTNYDILLEGIK